jgi:hypothetical protein
VLGKVFVRNKDEVNEEFIQAVQYFWDNKTLNLYRLSWGNLLKKSISNTENKMEDNI